MLAQASRGTHSQYPRPGPPGANTTPRTPLKPPPHDTHHWITGPQGTQTATLQPWQARHHVPWWVEMPRQQPCVLVRALPVGKTGLKRGCRRESNNQPHSQKTGGVEYQTRVDQAMGVCFKAAM
jgi:hypothetical protein